MAETSRISIRPAQLGDLAAIVDIYLASFARRSGTANFARDLKEIMLDSPYAMLYLVAVADEEVVGFVSAYPLDEVMIFTIWQSSEAGGRALEKLLAGIRSAAVGRDRPHNAGSCHFQSGCAQTLRKAGFITYGIREAIINRQGRMLI